MRPGTPHFVGARLREAREARDITAVSLASLLGISRQAVSQYENDIQTPSPDVMREISAKLNLPLHHFLRPQAAELIGTIYWRSMASATKAARIRALRRYGWLRELVAYIQQYVKFPDVRFPRWNLPNDPSAITFAQIEEIATYVRRSWGLGDGPISNVVTLLENNGAVVVRHELHAKTLDAFSNWRDAHATPYLILGSDKECAARSRFDAAHELAHLILHRHLGESALNNNVTFQLIELQAHYFAGAFLLPRTTFSANFTGPSLDSLRSMKMTWRVSIAAMIKRAVNLRLISPDDETRLNINLARRKWRTKEPLDDLLEPEEPHFLRRAFDLLLHSSRITMQELELQLAKPAADIEETAGLPRGYLGHESSPPQLRFPSNLPNSGNNTFWSNDASPLPFPAKGSTRPQ